MYAGLIRKLSQTDQEIAKKYGTEAIQNPKGNWTEENEEEYEDLDELLARYVLPMNDLTEDVCRHRKYDAELNDPDAASEKLMALRRAAPSSIPLGAQQGMDPPCASTCHAGFCSCGVGRNW